MASPYWRCSSTCVISRSRLVAAWSLGVLTTEPRQCATQGDKAHYEEEAQPALPPGAARHPFNKHYGC